MKSLLLVGALFFFQNSLLANITRSAADKDFYKIKSVTVTPISEDELRLSPLLMASPQDLQPMGYASDCTENNDNNFVTNNISISEVVRIGKQVWKLIQDNKAVAHVEQVSVNALPRGITCWDQLAQWKAPESKYYTVSYENMFGIEVVNVVYRITYAYGGSYKSQGRYLANVSVIPANIEVMWGFKFESSVRVPLTLNVGTEENPIAGIELNIQWKANSLNHNEQSMSVFIDGNGKIKSL